MKAVDSRGESNVNWQIGNWRVEIAEASGGFARMGVAD